eukprot:TRINITY_DN1205_c0_g1_i1.p1 TRINITY_DN1205_c0_g1~~TRINITY_DN1205_c0_g1_i1.p1  ORF type:complete len:194 (+),score=74.16 TRINITY_DN1205_c0_g1_i1:160-741(+)
MAEFKKGVEPSPNKLDGSPLRVLIVHTRWNLPIVDPLVQGAKETLKKFGVEEANIAVESVPGSYELPFACSKLLECARSKSVSIAPDLLATPPPQPKQPKVSSKPFDAVIAIGVLIKGSTMHFEYICDAVSHGLMRVQLDSGTPVIFGVLTCLTEDQAFERAGVGKGENKGHNHGEDWGAAAVEMALLKDRSV